MPKKIRLIWKERNIGDITYAQPEVSVDNGKYWISLEPYVGILKTSSNLPSYMKRRSSFDNFVEYDISISLTPEAVPMITGHTLVPNEENGLTPGSYYFSVACETYPRPGDNDSPSGAIYHGLPCKPYFLNITANSEVKLKINYPDFVKGLLVYMGSSPDEMGLIYVSNYVSELYDPVLTDDTDILITNGDPFPSVGTIKIDNEIIHYDNKIFSDDPTPHTTLTVASGGRQNPQEHSIENTLVELKKHIYQGQYTSLPERIYPTVIMPDNLIQYFPFDNDDSTATTIVNYVSSTNNGNVLGTINYSRSTAFSRSSLALNGAGNIDSNISVPNTGTIIGYFYMDKIPNEDYMLFGDRQGLWCGISKDTLRPYIGYKNNYLTNINDPRIPNIRLDEWNQIAVSFNISSLTLTTSLFVNTQLCSTSLLTSNVSTIGSPYIGANKQIVDGSPIAFNRFIGYIDEWRIYDILLDKDNLEYLHRHLSESGYLYSGEIVIDGSFNFIHEDINNYEPNYFTDVDNEDDYIMVNLSDVEEELVLRLNNWILEPGFSYDGSHIAYPIDTDMIKVKMGLETSSIFATPEVKDLVVIISETSLPE